MDPKAKKALKSFYLEVPLYALLAGAYVVLVLRFSSKWLEHLFKQDRTLYAVVAIVLIVGQGYFLELLTRTLLGLVKGRKEKK